jgi:integrase
MEGRLRRGSFTGYRLALQNHILPRLGHLHLTDLARVHVKDLLAEKQTAGLSRRTISNLHAVLHNCLAEAIEDGYLTANPAASRRGRGLGMTREERSANIKAMDRDQLRAFLTATDATIPARALLFRLLALTGLRLGEALALRWEDVDRTASMLRIERAVSRGRVGPPKTLKGVRDVALAPGLLEGLKAWDVAAKAKALQAAEPRAPWIFASRSGSPGHHGRVDQDFKVALAAAKLSQHFTPHCLRHTFASLHLQAGESIYWVSRQLGHASIKITVDVYGRWLPPGNLEGAGRLEAALSPGQVTAGGAVTRNVTGTW